MADQRNGGIAWCDSSWNPTIGCSRASEGCFGCYAESLAFRFKGPGQHYEGLVRLVNGHPTWTGVVREVPSKLADPLRWRRPRKIFLDSTSDIFHAALPDAAIDKIFAVMALSPAHIFQLLTKRSGRMKSYLSDPATPYRLAKVVETADFIHPYRSQSERQRVAEVLTQDAGWPLANVAVGVSVESQPYVLERLADLMATPAALRWASAEPLLSAIDIRAFLPGACDNESCGRCGRLDSQPGHGERCLGPKLDWLVIGGESGLDPRIFDATWGRLLIAQCAEAGTPCFFKQCGSAFYDADNAVAGARFKFPAGADARRFRRLIDRGGKNKAEWPEDLQVQQFPGLFAATLAA